MNVPNPNQQNFNPQHFMQQQQQQQMQQQNNNPQRITVRPIPAGADPQTGLTQQEHDQWMGQGAPNSWGQVTDALNNMGGLGGAAVNQTISNAIRSGDAGRVNQALNVLGLNNVDPNEIIGHFNQRAQDWNTSPAGQAAMQNFRNRNMANMSRHQMLQMRHQHLRQKYARMRAMGLTPPAVAQGGTIHHMNRFRPAFNPTGQDADGNFTFEANRPLRGGRRV